MEESEGKKFKKVFIFSRKSPQDSSIPFTYPVNRPISGEPGRTAIPPSKNINLPAGDSLQGESYQISVPPFKEDQKLSSYSSQSSLADGSISPVPAGIPPVITSKPIDELSDDRSGNTQGLKAASYPKHYVAAVKEKLSYMLNFQMKMAQLSKQLKDLMGRTTKGNKTLDRSENVQKENELAP